MSYRKINPHLLILLILALSGCSHQPSAKFNSNYPFADISSYGLFARDHVFNDLQRLSDFQRNRIELAIEETMEGLNYRYRQQDEADVIVSYFIVQSSLAELKSYNRKVKACLVCTEKEQRKLNKDIRIDMLIIDLLSASTLTSVYRQTTDLKVKPKNSSNENQQLIVEAVQQGLADLPKLVKASEPNQ